MPKRNDNTEIEKLILECETAKMFFAGEKASSYVVSLKDVTEQVDIQQRLAFSEKRFKALVQEGADMTAVVDQEGVYHYISPNYPDIVGYSEEDLLGKNAFDFIHPDDVVQIKEEFVRLFTERRVKSSIYRFQHKNGSWSFFQSTGSNLLNEETIQGIVINTVDITTLVHTRDALNRSNERFEILMKAGSESIWDYDLVRNEFFLSNGFKENFGIESKALGENHELIINHIHPSDSERVLACFRDVLEETDQEKWFCEYRLIKANGEVAYVKDQAVIMRGENGVAYRVVGALKDTTSEYFYHQFDLLEKEIMENSMSTDTDLRSILTTYIQKLEDFFPDIKASVMRIKDDTLQNLASPSLPSEYIQNIEGAMIGDNVGSCGTSAYLKEQIVVTDVFNDVRWDKFKSIAKKYGIKACWSYPILNANGAVIATFANYPSTNRMPNALEEHVIERSRRLISIFIEKFEYLKNIQKSNERYELINKASRDAIYEWDILSDIFYWNESFYTVFGYSKDTGVFRIADWANLMHPSDDQKLKEKWIAFLNDSGQNRWTKEFRFRKADGTYAYVEEIGHLIRDKYGKPLRMIGVLRDVSSVKLIEKQKQLQYQVSQFFKTENNLSETLSEVLKFLTIQGELQTAEIWLTSIDEKHLNVMSASRYAQTPDAALFFNESEDVIRFQSGEGLPGHVWKKGQVVIWDNIDENDLFARRTSAKKAGLKSAMGLPLFHKDKVAGVLLVCAGSKNFFTSSLVEQYEPLQYNLGDEIKRKQQEEEMFLLFHSAPEIMAIVSPDRYFVKVNPAFCNLLGYTEKELLEQPFDSFVHPNDLQKTNSDYSDAIAAQKRIYGSLNRYRTKSGNYRWISWTSSDTFGDEKFIFAYGRDMTEIVELQGLLENASKLSRVGGWEMDVVNDVQYWSPMTRVIHEVPDDFQPNLSTSINFYREDVRDKVMAYVANTIATGEPFDFEVPIITAKGKERWVRAIGNAEFFEGKCIRLYGSFQDIHERKVTELRFKNISDNVPGILFQYHLYPDGTDNLFYVSGGAEEVWGCTAEESMKDVAKIWEGIIQGGDFESVRQSITESGEQLTRWHSRWKYVKPDGSVRFHEGYGNPQKMTDGSIVWDSIVMDITEKHDLEELAERISVMARIGSWELDMVDGDTNEMYWSFMTREILEVAPSFETTLIHGFDFFKGDYRAQIETAVARLIATGEPFDLQLLLTTAKGNPRWVRCIGKSDRVGDRCLKIFGSLQDIHSQKITELELQKSFEERNNILESIGDAFFAVDKNWTVTYWNKEAENVLSRRRKDVLGKSLWDSFPDAVGLKFYTEYHTAMQTGEVLHFEEHYPTSNQWFEVSVYPSDEGLSVYFKDVSIRKTAEEEIRQTNERFEKVTEATNDAIWDWDIQNNTYYRSEGFDRLFGYKIEKDISSDEFWERHFLTDDMSRIAGSIDEAINDPKTSRWEAEYKIIKKDKSSAYVIDRGVIIRNNKGKALRMIGAMTDITYRKEYEESLKRLNTQLEKQTKELMISNKELEQFAYIASHDLQEPLRMVTSFLNQLKRKYNNQLDEKAHQYIHFAVDGSLRMRQIILDILEFSRVGKHEENKEVIDLNQIVDEVCQLQHRLIEEKVALVHYEHLPRITSYRSPILQVFQNLIGNALKYSKPNVSVTIEVTAKETKDEWEIAIMDNGIGISKEYHEKIFILFQRLHVDEEYRGTGIGLAIVKKILDNLGGRIWVESEEGAGSTFYFTIPK
ncbi:Bacteriophytochrome [Flavobacterium saliperosum S13]|uniref:histidine kinase n=2 Tax=Flavobacterium saliperosum TaxID=329186 RepID=A0A1G4VP96_9FLAO|nr:PAS domain-containing protein [Flavobacterium saliperosum]ESU23938.1 Bacteriophytochrome [Flavobacterium saliperosum S13]SCX09793.1 PAS domain S-box-containing protein [Flavobacterium saliperosum]